MKKLITITMALLFALLVKAETGTHWTFSSDMQYMATATAELYYDGVSMRGAAEAQYYEIGAFVGEECRGSYLPDEIPPMLGGGSLYNMTIYSNVVQGEEVTFRLYNHQTGQEMDVICNTTITFQSDATFGDAMDPLPIYFLTDTTPRYIITVAANPAEGGTVDGGGRFREGDERTVTATPNIAYNFSSWTNNNVVVSNDAAYTFTVTEDADLVANFDIKVFNIAASADPSAYGTVTGGGLYEYGSTVTLTATPNTGYLFYNWTKDGVEYSTEPVISFAAEDGVSGAYVAHFATKIYTITALANPSAGGSVTGAGSIQEGQYCTLTATPNTAYNFVNWTKNGVEVSTNPTYSFMVVDNETYVANFTLKTFEIVTTASPSNYGVALGGGTYNYGVTVNLMAIPNGDYVFANWKKNGTVVSNNASYSFTAVDGVEGEYVAHFSTGLLNITASVNPAGTGTVTGAGSYPEGQECTLVATANMGYKFVNWTLNGTEVSTDDHYTFAVTAAGAYVANFAEITPHWTFDSHMQFQLTGTMEATLDGVQLRHSDYGHYYELAAFVGDECRGSYLPSEAPPFFGGGYFYNMTVYSEQQNGETLTFRLYDHYTETEVNAVCLTTLPFQANANYGVANATQLIEFVTDPTPRYDITATVNPAEGGAVEGAGSYREGDPCTLVATPNAAYNFVNWTKQGVEVSTNPTYTFTVTEAAEYVAHFSLKTFAVTVTAEPAEYGSVTGSGTYAYGTAVTLTGTPNTGYLFFNWTKNGTVVSTDATYSFTAQDGVEGEYVGHFATKIFEITASANPAAGGTVAGAGQIQEGQTCTLVATPNTGYQFVNWTKNGVEVSTNATYAFTVMDDGAYVANFELKSYQITVSGTPDGYGTVTGAGTYVYGATCTLVATPNGDYIFANWTKDDVVVSEDATYSFTANDATEGAYVAHFARSLYQINASANPAEGGTVAGAGAYMEGQTCTLTATANLYYKFVNWTKAGEEVSTESTYSFVIADGVEGDYVANFEPITAHWTFNNHMAFQMTATLVLYIEDQSMRNDPNCAYYEIGAFAGDQCRGSYLADSVPPFLGGGYVYNVTLYSNQQQGETLTFRLYNHLTDQESDLTCSTTMAFVADGNYGDANDPVVVNFVSIPSYDITVAANPTEGGTVAGAGTYLESTEITLTATPGETYNFVNWTLNGEVVSTNAVYTFTVMGEGDYVANFELKSYEIVTNANPVEGGVLEGAGTYVHGTTCTLTALPGEAYNFLNWSDGNGVVSTDTEYTFTVTGPATYTANFEIKTYQVTVICDPVAGGHVLGARTYNHGATCTLTAASEADYAFVNWTENGVEVSRENPYSFTVTEDHEFVAHYLMYHWEYHFGQFPDVMGIFAVASIEGVEQTSDMLELAAFIGDECRGREKAIYLDDFGRAFFFLTVSGEDEEVFDSYRLYDHATGTELDVYCTQPIEFIPDGDLGDLIDPYVFEFAHRQTFELGAGFNWFAPYIELNNVNGWAMLTEAVGTHCQRILSQVDFTNYYASVNAWYPDINALVPLNNESMYRIVMADPMTLNLYGPFADPAVHPITISKGTSHIGFVSSEPIALKEAFNGLEKTNYDMVKTQTKYATYYADYDTWWGSLVDNSLLIPGEGLMYKSNNDNTVTFTYPSASAKGMGMEAPEAEEYHWEANYMAYPGNMTVMAVVELGDEELASEAYELAAFANGECRGSIRLKYAEPIDRYVAFLTVAGDEAATLDLRLFNAETGEEFLNADRNLVFKLDDMVGDPKNPFVVRFNNTQSGNVAVYPNPVNNGERFHVVLASDEPVQVEIVNSLGVVVASVRTASSEIMMDVPEVQGVYTVRVIARGEKLMKMAKLIVK